MPLPPLLPAEAAVLLVLLAAPDAARPVPLVPAGALVALQQQLGAAVRVLRIDALSHPAVVSSFHAAELPCFVLVHRGIELWRQCGSMGGGLSAPLLLSRLSPAGAAD